MKNLLTVLFSERTRQPTTEEIQKREETLRATEDMLWGSQGAVHHIGVTEDGRITSRAASQLEKLTSEFENTKRYVGQPSLTALSLYDDGSVVSLSDNEALAFRQKIKLQPNFLVFPGVDSVSEIDVGTRAINNDMVKAYGFQGNSTYVFAKHAFGSRNESLITVLPYSEERFQQIIRAMDFVFDEEKHGTNFVTNVRPNSQIPKPFN